MKSMMLTGIRSMEMKEVPSPQLTGDRDVLIRMTSVGVCGSDIHYYSWGRIGSRKVDYPFPVGHEGAGVVISTGRNVTRVKSGDRIAIEPAMSCGECDQCLAGRPHTCRKLRFLGCPGEADGCLSEFIVMPEESCFPVPGHMTDDQAALVEPLSIGLYAVRQAVDMKGAAIAILGHGPIGMSVLLSARALGAGRIYVTDRIDERLDIAAAAGAEWTGNPDKTDVVAEIGKREDRLMDAVFECCGKQEAMDQAIGLIKPGGKIMIIGIPEFESWSLPADVTRRKETIIQNVRRQNHCVQPAIDLIAQGKVDTGRMVTHRYPLDRVPEAFDLVETYGDGVMKAMIGIGIGIG